MTGHPEARTSIGTPSGGALWLAVAGSCFILLGGLVAAVTDPLDLHRGSWLAAYMVLVCGVAQFVMGRAPSWFDDPVNPRLEWTQLIGWNAGNVLVMVGTLTELPNLVDLGGVILFVILIDMLRDSMRRSGPPANAMPDAESDVRRWIRWGYRSLLVLLVVSIPVGLVLAHLRVD